MKLKPSIFLASTFFAFVIGIFLIGSSPAIGQGFAYTPLEQLPGASGAATLPQYIEGIYKFGIWTVGIAALFMLSVGGFVYMTSGGNTATLSRAKGYIADALIGLVLALLAYLILYVINPDLVNLNLSRFSEVGGSAPPPITQTESGGIGRPKPSGTCVTTASETGTTTESMKTKAAKILKEVSMNSSGDCKGVGNIVISPTYNFQQVASGQLMTKCFDGCRDIAKCGGSYCSATTFMSEAALDVILKTQAATENAIGINRFSITSVAGGDHSANSDHYHGKSIDVVLTGNNIGWGATLKAFVDNGAVADNGTKTGSFCEAINGAYINCLGKNASLPTTSAGTNHLHVRLP